MQGTILVVDDEAFELDLLQQELADRGYTVKVASGGNEALQALEKYPPQAVLLDYVMPGMSGIEVLKSMQALTAKPVVVFMTGYHTPKLARAALDQGASAVIAKPLDLDQLEITLQNLIKGSQTGAHVHGNQA